jgi:hypothetical protein
VKREERCEAREVDHAVLGEAVLLTDEPTLGTALPPERPLGVDLGALLELEIADDRRSSE